jgi:hypothetical protein
MKLETLIDRINEEIESMARYNESEESAMAEFVQSFGYGEGEPDFSDLEPHAIEAIEKLKARHPDDFLSRLGDYCHLSWETIYLTHNEIYSASPGETEDQLSDELVAQLESLTPDQLETVGRSLNGYLSGDMIYLDYNYNRWVMVLDVHDLCADMGVEIA